MLFLVHSHFSSRLLIQRVCPFLSPLNLKNFPHPVPLLVPLLPPPHPPLSCLTKLISWPVSGTDMYSNTWHIKCSIIAYYTYKHTHIHNIHVHYLSLIVMFGIYVLVCTFILLVVSDFCFLEVWHCLLKLLKLTGCWCNSFTWGSSHMSCVCVRVVYILVLAEWIHSMFNHPLWAVCFIIDSFFCREREMKRTFTKTLTQTKVIDYLPQCIIHWCNTFQCILFLCPTGRSATAWSWSKIQVNESPFNSR